MLRTFEALCVLLIMSLGADAAEPQAELRVMSFNIRYATAPDGENGWFHRKEFLLETIRDTAPDLLGTQETLKMQKDFLDSQLLEYESFAAGRQDGQNAGEMAAVWFRKDRFERLDGGHFWLSETPEVVGSRGWDSAIMRMATWVKLRDRKAAGQPTIWFFNTHFDHRGAQARLESAKLLRERVRALADGDPAVVTGDFNAGADSPPYRAFFQSEPSGTPFLYDTYRVVHPRGGEPEGTFNGFDPAATTGQRIDWIAVTGHWKTLAAAIDRRSRDGRTPSDHFPITAQLQYAK